MADEKKPGLNLDDWDSLPLDPEADDWDDEPPAAVIAERPVQPEPAFPPPGPEAPGLETAALAAGVDAPAGEAAESPAEADVQELSPKTDPANLEVDDFGDPVAPFRPEEAPAAPAAAAPRPETPKFMDDALAPREAAGAEEAPKAKKVELDIEGIFLGSAAPAPPPVEEQSPPPPPRPEVPPAPREPEVRKIAKTKMLILIIPAAVALLGLILGAYKIFFSRPPEAPLAPEKPLVIETRAPPREPAPGEIQVGPFYINFPGRRSDIVAEMFVVIYYEDAPDRFFIENELTVIRDIIYRATQGLGAEVIADSQLQKRLRQELTEKSNAALGAPRISFIQISQMRVLQ
ncbi:MAG: hypothetical protein LBS31_11695 [Candidatus Adiutrix sp.]|jgi:flagellar basal body-associated protein FliL|nr:hypothetical protein [Candidatus Adiutrix sp.]